MKNEFLIAEESLYMTKKDLEGFHKVMHRYCYRDSYCFKFNCFGMQEKHCENYRTSPAGKMCLVQENGMIKKIVYEYIPL